MVAESLAAKSEAVADALGSGDGCGARRKAAALRAEAEKASMPEPIRQELERVLADTNVVCVAKPSVPPTPVATAPDNGDENGKSKHERKKDKKDRKDKKHGHDDHEGDE